MAKVYYYQIYIGKSFENFEIKNHVSSIGIGSDLYRKIVTALLNTKINVPKEFTVSKVGIRPLYFFTKEMGGLLWLTNLEYELSRKIQYITK